jgi:hypothetical protein
VNGRLASVVFASALLVGGAGCGNSAAAPDLAQQRGDARRYEGSFTVLESPSHGPELCANVNASLPPQCGGVPIRNWKWETVNNEESRNGTTWGAWHVVGTYRDGAFTLTEPPAPPRQPPEVAHVFAPACDHPDVVDASAGEASWESATQDRDPLAVDELVTMWVAGSGGTSDHFVVNVIVRPGGAGAATSAIRARYAGALCVVEKDLPPESRLRAVQAEMMDEEARDALGQVQSAAADPARGAVVAQVWVVDEATTTYARNRWGGLVILESLLHRMK